MGRALIGGAGGPGSLAVLAAMRRASSRVEEVRRCSPSRLILEIDVRERLPDRPFFPDDEASVRFLDGPRRREAAGW